MFAISRLSTRAVFRLGAGALALRGVLQMVLAHARVETDLTDFVSGALIGIGGSLLLIVAWRNGRGPRGADASACSR